MKQLAVACMAILGLSGCVAMHYEVWTPVDPGVRESREADKVEHLEAPPDKPYTVLGIITPLADEYGSNAEAVKAMRTVAAKHGADAIFIESHPQTGVWQFSAEPFGESCGCSNFAIFQAKAIVWQQSAVSH